MSLPPGFLDELRQRLSLAQVVGRKVMWDQRKSNQAKGDMWAPCPFHQEKTASFHVDDQKGYYYCFGCHAKGDMVSFVRETENVDFIEAVRILAQEAGLAMPERDPRAQEKADHRTQLTEVMEQALRFYRMALRTGAAEQARDYLDHRGLSAEAQDRWEIGYAPGGWQALWDHLTGKGVEPKLILDCGLAKPSSKGGRPYDTFRDRILFPIRDGRGRMIAFGGRAMDPNDGAKYLNSPQTELFDKGRTVYNLAPARAAAGKAQQLIVAEGYMDVIALSEAGYEAAVAPLGTAITEDQLRLLWRIAPEPLIALDGDKAGLNAAYRLIDLALPLIEAGQSLRFALMPEGQDPDDLIRSGGAGAVQARLDDALPMVDLLWRRETEGRIFDSPERRAALDKVLRQKISLVQDPSLRSHYGQAIKELRWQLFNPRRESGGAGRAGGWPRRGQAPTGPQSDTRNSLLASQDAADQIREAVILAALIVNPQVFDEFSMRLEELDLFDPDHQRLRQVMLGCDIEQPLRAQIEAELGHGPLDQLFARPHVAVVPAIRRPGDPEMARQLIAGELAKLAAGRGHAQELSEILEDYSDKAGEHLIRRLDRSARQKEQAERGETEDRTEYVIGKNGVHMRKEERNEFDKLLQRIDFAKGKSVPK